MGYKMIEITEDKQYELSEHAEKILKHAGKLMQCLEDMCEEGENQMGQRGGYGQRDGGGYMGERFGGRYSGVSGQMEGMRGGRMGRRVIDPYYE